MVFTDNLTGTTVAPAVAQAGGKRRGRPRKTTRGGAGAELSDAFPGIPQQAYLQGAAATATHFPPIQVGAPGAPIAPAQAGGKRRGRSRKTTRGGACPLTMAELGDAFMPVPNGAVPFPPTTPDTLTALKAQTGGKKRRSTKKH
jgi:hypothetical protein